ncbi:hypothetical protein [Flavobacterium tructae]|uniref:Uncharacterized protein n=1 Tax=Flavobacterium tructae TaxID=1114873 RepID=A0A1S1J3T6_9FLAO|nr:hypothetical protein [Flavobacterium tructae]OHT44440.1 hypothetical protein BHE19_12020 [Flavobacterium tructae]OXB19424.1 hypothetical protein B0A71_12855 [Flavobacterium tructae]
MDSNVKKEVENHILKASGLGEKSVGYKAIQQLFSMEELDLMFKYELLLDIRRGCIHLGLNIQLSRDKIYIDEDVVKNYYEKVMGLQYPEQKPELTYYDRIKLNRKEQ